MNKSLAEHIFISLAVASVGIFFCLPIIIMVFNLDYIFTVGWMIGSIVLLLLDVYIIFFYLPKHLEEKP